MRCGYIVVADFPREGRVDSRVAGEKEGAEEGGRIDRRRWGPTPRREGYLLTGSGYAPTGPVANVLATGTHPLCAPHISIASG